MMLIFIILLTIVLLILPVLMIYFGKYYTTNIPKEINKSLGYRTKMSMINDDTWKFAHKYWGDICGKIGVFLVPIPILPMIFSFSILKNDIEHIGVLGFFVIALIIIEMVAYNVAIFLTEKALKKNFNQDGVRIKEL